VAFPTCKGTVSASCVRLGVYSTSRGYPRLKGVTGGVLSCVDTGPGDCECGSNFAAMQWTRSEGLLWGSRLLQSYMAEAVKI